MREWVRVRREQQKEIRGGQWQWQWWRESKGCRVGSGSWMARVMRVLKSAEKNVNARKGVSREGKRDGPFFFFGSLFECMSVVWYYSSRCVCVSDTHFHNQIKLWAGNRPHLAMREIKKNYLIGGLRVAARVAGVALSIYN